jgi:DNA-binding NtrC family response regulator
MSAHSEILRPNRPERTTRTARVLVIDGELFVVQALRLVLAREFDVTGTTNTNQALDWVLSGEVYDVILCDAALPRLGAVQFRDRIEAHDAEQASRVVFLTSDAVLPEVRGALERAAHQVIEKPIDLDGLRELIRRRTRRTWQTADRAI